MGTDLRSIKNGLPILLFFLLSHLTLMGQKESLVWSNNSNCTVTISFYEEDEEYNFSIYSNLTSSCEADSTNVILWAEELASLVKKEPDINMADVLVQLKICQAKDALTINSIDLNSTLSHEDSIVSKTIFELADQELPFLGEILLFLGNGRKEIFTILHESAEFPGGLKEWAKYLSINLRYPEEAQRLGVEGRVFVQFIVEKDGSLTDIKVVKGIVAGCNEEAIRLIKESPKWNPGKRKNGEVVRQKYIQNILFKLP